MTQLILLVVKIVINGSENGKHIAKFTPLSGTQSEKTTGLCGKNSQEDCGGYMGRLRRLYGLLVWNFSI